ncbi:Aste57867_13103 [Aphanomyces stellatus]|uniref:Aste57867_13103 protein n=1 Tax=Aphanomyces stellatus TaxID=120398 RepID=A0A485KXL3_9STRA|nr:hypothetical protein As57867_013055 [Aphanomyces stellatus]VFT89947.1 Aste57867_13103 [Aphanomyces stellatus]
MINVREFQALQTQLLKEGNERFELQEKNKQLAARVTMLERDLSTKEYELSVAAASNRISTKEDVHELVEMNIALKEQIRVMKGALDTMQSTPLPPAEGSSNGPTTADQGDLTDIQTLLGKLTAKEEELSAIREECRIWEEQVIQLKFELQSEKFNAQERAKEAKKPAKGDAVLDVVSLGFNNATRSSTELQEYKSLAMQRAEYWKLAEMALEKANVEIAGLKTEVAHLRADAANLDQCTSDDHEDDHGRAENPQHGQRHHHHQHSHHLHTDDVAEARRQAALAQDTLTAAMKEVARLTAQVDDMPVQQGIELKKAKYLVRDLQRELGQQKYVVCSRV